MLLTMTPTKTEKDLALLQGTWEQVGVEADGVAKPSDEFSAGGALATFEGSEFSVVSAEGNILLKGTFHLDATTIPRQATWIDAMGPDKGKQLPGIYNLSGDNFVFVAAADAQTAKPTDFRTETGQTMRRFVRRSRGG
ncbi:MAG: TIGR03067 domain-containing protein [Rhizomicrobium sp.]